MIAAPRKYFLDSANNDALGLSFTEEAVAANPNMDEYAGLNPAGAIEQKVIKLCSGDRRASKKNLSKIDVVSSDGGKGSAVTVGDGEVMSWAKGTALWGSRRCW